MDYAIIKVGNKQHRVHDGELLVVDRIHADEGKTFAPEVLLGDVGIQVTAKVVAHERGPKIRVGKYRRRTGYRRHTGFRAATTRIEISLGAAKRAAAKKETPKVEAEAASAERTEPAEAVPVGLPEGYAQLTVAAIARDAKSWTPEELAAALAYESEHGKRKGALAALSSALSAAEEGSA